MVRWFNGLSRRWKLAIVWIPFWGVVMGLFWWVSRGDIDRLPLAIVGGLIIGIVTYVSLIRRGSW
jgi:hypothetical protein